ncbi:hypothetical protein Cato_76 [Acinetobacter phage Cato]|nr:hypothetical protein Cato_76 [Acinetobacter phage Cato]
MNKLELAQQYMVLVFSEAIQDFENIELHIKHLPRICFDMAEAMLAENEKRQDKSRPEVLEDWQPDWSQAPEGFDWWAVDKDGQSHYYDAPPEIGAGQWLLGGDKYQKGIKFEIFTVNWKDSLRKRP